VTSGILDRVLGIIPLTWFLDRSLHCEGNIINIFDPDVNKLDIPLSSSSQQVTITTRKMQKCHDLHFQQVREVSKFFRQSSCKVETLQLTIAPTKNCK